MCRQDHHHVNFAVEGQLPDRSGLARTQSVPLRRRSSMKGCSQSPTKQEMHAFETLLEGTSAQMPNRLQLLATHSISRYSLPTCYDAFLANLVSMCQWSDVTM